MPEGTGQVRETDGVARLLQELKSRSGLSYGALATRLHVSTSALHRYCNGEVMPVEFAPLERLARACRATPEEHTELYRLWVTAQTARENRPSAPAAAPGAPECAPAPQAAPDAAAQPRPAAASIPAGPRRRVRRSVLAAVTAAAVLATVGAVATGLRTRTGGDPASAPASAPVSAPAPAADAAPSAGSPAPLAAPITVAVRWPGRADGCEKYLVDRPPSQVPRPPALVDVPTWVSQVGAVAGHYQSIEFAVQGTGSETVVLTALDVRVVRSAAPLAWNAYSMGEGCGGGVDLHSYDLDLDAARPRLVVSEGSTGLPVKVSERDPEVIEVSAETTSHDVSWYLELEWSSGDRKGTLTVGPGAGAPFRTSAVKGRPLFSYPIGGKAWEPSPFQQ